MSVLNLLPHHLVILNLLWLSTFLPELEFTVLLMVQLRRFQLAEQCLALTILQEINDLASCSGLETVHYRRQFRCGYDHVQMILQNQPGKKLEFSFSLQEPP